MDNLQLIDYQLNELVYSKQPIQMMLANGLANSSNDSSNNSFKRATDT